MREVFDVLCIVSIVANLGFYAYGNHQPASLAVALLCMFAVLWQGRRK